MNDNEKEHATKRLIDATYLYADGFRDSRQHKEDEQELFAAAFAFAKAHLLDTSPRCSRCGGKGYDYWGRLGGRPVCDTCDGTGRLAGGRGNG